MHKTGSVDLDQLKKKSQKQYKTLKLLIMDTNTQQNFRNQEQNAILYICRHVVCLFCLEEFQWINFL